MTKKTIVNGLCSGVKKVLFTGAKLVVVIVSSVADMMK